MEVEKIADLGEFDGGGGGVSEKNILCDSLNGWNYIGGATGALQRMDIKHTHPTPPPRRLVKAPPA